MGMKIMINETAQDTFCCRLTNFLKTVVNVSYTKTTLIMTKMLFGVVE